MFSLKQFAIASAALAAVGLGSYVRGAVLYTETDNFPGTSVDSSIWNTTDRGLESIGPAGYNAPSVSGGVLTLGGTTSNQYWYGSTLESVNSFHADGPVETVSVTRDSLSGSGTAWRSSLWIYAGPNNFIHFSQDVGESSWQVNCNGCGGFATPTNIGTSIGAFNASQNDGGSHVMKLVLTPGLGGNDTIQPFLDGTAGPIISFNGFPSTFQVFLTGQARFSGDTVSAKFSNFSVTPEPASLGLLGLGGLGLLARRPRA